MVNGVPVLINEEQSIFTIQSIIDGKDGFFDRSKKGRILESLSRLLPVLQTNLHTKQNFAYLKQQLLQLSDAKILVIGAGNEGRGISDFIRTKQFKFVMSDVFLGPSITIVLDAHSIPYENQTFDCVVVQAVLEHVLNPQQCVQEFHRILKLQGLIYAETPFMQQVHGGAYDFTRFSNSGHRWLFRNFAEIASGFAAGPASALAWSIQHFFISLLPRSRTTVLSVKFISRCLLFWLKYFDYMMKNNLLAMDGACSCFFLGRKATMSISPKEMPAYYQQDL